jgi:hypothetical protein
MAVPTLGQIHRPPGWLWLHCTRYVPLCQHRAPMAIAPFVIRWGPDASSDMLRRYALHRVRAQGRDAARSGMGVLRRRWLSTVPAGTAAMNCARYDDTFWVCEEHDDKPADLGTSSRACRCGAPAMPCPNCNARDDPRAGPKMPPGFRTDR